MVIYLVLRKGIVVLISLQTNITFIVLRFSMELPVLSQIMQTGEALLTFLATEGSVTSVTSHVDFKRAV